MMVELPSEIWTMILELCYERWQAELCSNFAAPWTLTQCRAQVTARSVCRAWRAAMQKFPLFLHLDLSEVDESARSQFCVLRALAGTGRPFPWLLPCSGLRLSVATSSVRVAKTVSRSCLAPVIQTLYMHSGAQGQLSTDLQQIRSKISGKITVASLNWPPWGDSIISPVCRMCEQNCFGCAKKTVLRFKKLFPDFPDRKWQEKLFSIRGEILDMCTLCNVLLAEIKQFTKCSKVKGGVYWDMSRFVVENVVLTVRHHDDIAMTAIVPASTKSLTVSAGSNHVIKRRFTELSKFKVLEEEFIPENYIPFSKVRTVRLAHIEIGSFEKFMSVFSGVKNIIIGPRVHNLAVLRREAEAMDIRIIN